LEREAIVAAAKLTARDKESGNGEDGSRPSTADLEKPPEEEGGWQDAAWLLSVASKAFF
jgi:hypothetical protein